MKSQEELKILFAGGGTGGHAAPVFALYEKISAEHPEIKTYVIGVGTREEEAFYKNIPNYHKILSGKINRQATLGNIPQLVKLLIGFFQALYLVLKIKPNVVFSKGGFASLPVVLACKTLGVTYFLHESDIEMGKTNRFMSKGAKTIFVSYPVEYYSYLKNKKIFTGPLLRQKLEKNKIDRSDLSKLFQFDNNKPVIFLTGGSQGSLNLSKNFIAIAQDLLSQFNIIHQAGKHSIEVSEEFKKSLSKDLQKDYYLIDLLKVENGVDKFSVAADLADIVISRAGSTIVELAIKGKPMILIPWKYSAQDHQVKNAEFLKSQNAALVIKEDDLTPDLLKDNIYSLFNDKDKLSLLSTNASKIFPINGVDVVLQEILRGAK